MTLMLQYFFSSSSWFKSQIAATGFCFVGKDLVRIKTFVFLFILSYALSDFAFPPFLVFFVPAYSLIQRIFKSMLLLPSESFDFCCIYTVPLVIEGPVLYIINVAFILTQLLY